MDTTIEEKIKKEQMDINTLHKQIEQHPDVLITILSDIKEDFSNVKEIKEAEPAYALELIDNNINKLFLLKQINPKTLPIDAQNVLYWLNQIDHLTNLNNQLKSMIISQSLTPSQQNQEHEQSNNHTINTFIATDWKYPTLQETYNIDTFIQLVLPILMPSLYPIDTMSKILILTGKSNTGKSFTIDCIKQLLEEKQQSVTWYYTNNYEFHEKRNQLMETILQHTQPQSQSSSHPTSYVITDFLSYDLVDESNQWTSILLVPWLLFLQKLKTVKWIILCHDVKQINFEILQLHHPTVIPYGNPSARTIHHYLKHLTEIYYLQKNNQKPIESYKSIPLLNVNEKLKLSQLSIQMAKHQVNFQDIQKYFTEAILLNNILAMQDNGIYWIGEQYLTKKSLQFPIKQSYDYYLLINHQQDVLEHTGSQYWNYDLLDALPTIENDKFSALFFPETVSKLYGQGHGHGRTRTQKRDQDISFIGQTNISICSYPYPLEIIGWKYVFQLIANYNISIWKQIGIGNGLTSVSFINKEIEEIVENLSKQRKFIQNLITINDIYQHASLLRPFFWNQLNFPSVELRKYFQELFRLIPIGTVLKYELVVENIERFTISYGTTLKSLPIATSAEDMRTLLMELCEQSSCQVIQIKLVKGNMWIIEFEKPLSKSFKCTNKEGHLIPFVQLLSMFDDNLCETYGMTNESDYDLITQTFPTNFVDIYRDEVDSWIMKQLDHDCLHLLNQTYTKEQKFVLNMYYHLMKLSDHYTVFLKSEQQLILSNLLANLRNYIDFMFEITEEDATTSWSISTNYNNATKTMDTHRYTMSMYWLFTALHLFPCILKEEQQDLSHVYQLLTSGVEQRMTSSLYVKSKLSMTQWEETVAMSSCLPLATLMDGMEGDRSLFADGFIHIFYDKFIKTLWYVGFINAVSYGIEETATRIAWYTINSKSNMFGGMVALLQLIRQKSYALKDIFAMVQQKNHRLWLFAGMVASFEPEDKTPEQLVKTFLALLLYFNTLYTTESLILPMAGEERTISQLFHCIDQDGLMLQQLHTLFGGNWNGHGQGNESLFTFQEHTTGIQKIDKEKKILEREHISKIQNYGLKTDYIALQFLGFLGHS